MKIQKELNETKETLQKAIQSTLERGECTKSRIEAGDIRTYCEQEANGTFPISRRETRQPRRKVRQPERVEQDVLHPGKEAELVLRGHVNSWTASEGIRIERILLGAFARRPGGLSSGYFHQQETLRTFAILMRLYWM